MATVQLLLLPVDPETQMLHIDDALWAWVEEQKSVDIAGRAIRLGDQRHPTAHAAALVGGYGSREPWSHYVAIHRSSAIELGLGDRGGWERQTRNGEAVRVFSLISIVSHTWALLAFGAALKERHSLDGPWLLTVALRDTKGALLGDVGEGWAEPGSSGNTVGGCVEPSLLWHLELHEWPDEDSQQRLAFEVGNRVEDAWGVTQRRYLARVGDSAGRLDLRRISF